MDFRMSRRAEWEIARRGIAPEVIRHVLSAPEQRIGDDSDAGLFVCQSRSPSGDGRYTWFVSSWLKTGATCCRYGLPYQQDRQVLESSMKLLYDSEVDVLSIVFSDSPVIESDQDKPGLILDYDAAGNVVCLEILRASTRMADPKTVEYGVLPSTVWPTPSFVQPG